MPLWLSFYLSYSTFLSFIMRICLLWSIVLSFLFISLYVLSLHTRFINGIWFDLSITCLQKWPCWPPKYLISTSRLLREILNWINVSKILACFVLVSIGKKYQHYLVNCIQWYRKMTWSDSWMCPIESLVVPSRSLKC
jgi:hypothetical protein